MILFEGAIVRLDDSDGFEEGKIVRSKEGVLVGEAHGAVLGMDVGASDGALLGRIVGEALGAVLGMDVGASDGALLGGIVGGALG